VHLAHGLFVRGICAGEQHSYDAMFADLLSSLRLGYRPEEILAASVRVLDKQSKYLQTWVSALDGILTDTQNALLNALLADQAGHKEALKWMEKANALQKESAMQMHLIDFQARYGKIKQSIASLEKLLQQQPDDPMLLNALGFTLVDSRQRLDEAEVYLRRAYRLAFYETAIVDSMGWLFFRRRQFMLAQQWLKRAYEQAPTDPEVTFHLAETYRVLGEHSKARLLCQKVLNLHPNGTLKKQLKCGV